MKTYGQRILLSKCNGIYVVAYDQFGELVASTWPYTDNALSFYISKSAQNYVYEIRHLDGAEKCYVFNGDAADGAWEVLDLGIRLGNGCSEDSAMFAIWEKYNDGKHIDFVKHVVSDEVLKLLSWESRMFHEVIRPKLYAALGSSGLRDDTRRKLKAYLARHREYFRSLNDARLKLFLEESST